MIDRPSSLLLGLLLLTTSLSITSGQASGPAKTYPPHKLNPVDEGKTDASFKAFREKLIKAVADTDTKFLISVIDKEIKLSFGGDEGIKKFRKLWKPEDPKSEIWSKLHEVLRLGGTFGKSKNEFWTPYIFSRFPEQYDAFEYSAVIAKDVKVRGEPNATAPVVATLSYDIVQTLPDQDSDKRKEAAGSEWVRIRLPEGREGFVSNNSIRSPIDYRACFKKTGARWLLTQFVAGD